METDPVAAEVCRERSKAVCFAGRICDIQPDRELQGDPDSFAGIVVALFGCDRLIREIQRGRWFCRKQHFKGEGQCLLLSRLDQ